MVLALAVPQTFAGRDLLVTMTFGVVILSILGEGLTMPGLLRRLSLVDDRSADRRFVVAREEFRAARSAVEELDYLSDAGLVPSTVEAHLRERYHKRLMRSEAQLREAVESLGSGAANAGATAVSGSTLDNAPDGSLRSAQLETAGPDMPALRSQTNAVARRLERHLLDIERDRLRDALRSGSLTEDEYAKLVADLDERRATLHDDEVRELWGDRQHPVA
jgi:NhaP-type Na+/H+ or K+/H+ antiporter